MVGNSSQSQEIKDQIKSNNRKKYGYDHPDQSDSIKENKKRLMMERFGVEYPAHLLIPTETLSKLSDKEWMEHKHHGILNKSMTVYNVFTADASNTWLGTYTSLNNALNVYKPLSIKNAPNVFTIIKTNTDSDNSIQDRWYVALGFLMEYTSS